MISEIPRSILRQFREWMNNLNKWEILMIMRFLPWFLPFYEDFLTFSWGENPISVKTQVSNSSWLTGSFHSYQLAKCSPVIFFMHHREITDSNGCRPECPWYLSTCRDEVDVIDNEILEVQLSASKPETRAKSGNPGSTWGLTNEAKLSSTNHLYIPPFGLLRYEKILRTHLHYNVSKLSSAPLGIRIQ